MTSLADAINLVWDDMFERNPRTNPTQYAYVALQLAHPFQPPMEWAELLDPLAGYIEQRLAVGTTDQLTAVLAARWITEPMTRP